MEKRGDAQMHCLFFSPDGAVRHEFFHPPPGRSESCGPFSAVPWHAHERWGHDIHDPTQTPVYEMWVKIRNSRTPQDVSFDRGFIIAGVRSHVNKAGLDFWGNSSLSPLRFFVLFAILPLRL